MADEEALHDDIEAYVLATLSRESALALETAMRDSPALLVLEVAEARAVVAALAETGTARAFAAVARAPAGGGPCRCGGVCPRDAYPRRGARDRAAGERLGRRAGARSRGARRRPVTGRKPRATVALGPKSRSRVLAAACADRQRSAAPPAQPDVAAPGRRSEADPTARPVGRRVAADGRLDDAGGGGLPAAVDRPRRGGTSRSSNR